MSRLSNEHLKSIDRTLTIMRIARNRQKIPKYQKELDRDIKHLAEISELVEYECREPQFSALEDTACPLVV